MENSVRTALKFPAGATGSVQQRFAAAKVASSPKSLRELMNLVSPESQTFTAHLEAGDVTVDTRLTLASNGEFFWNVASSDSGTFFGDNYAVAVTLSGVSPDGQVFALAESGEVENKETAGWTRTGHSAWVKENWAVVRGSSMHAHLKASADVEVLDVLSLALKALGIAALAVAAYMLGPGDCKWGVNEEGKHGCRIEF